MYLVPLRDGYSMDSMRDLGNFFLQNDDGDKCLPAIDTLQARADKVIQWQIMLCFQLSVSK